MDIKIQTLNAWDVKRIPPKPRKKWITGILFIICTICAILLFIFHESFPFPYPITPIILIILGIFFYILGTVLYKKEASRIADKQRQCLQCGHPMKEHITNMQTQHLNRIDLSRVGLLHRFIIKDRLFEGIDKRVYITGKKQYSPGTGGYAGWSRTAFILKAKWLVCPDCNRAYIQDVIFEEVAETEEEVEELVKDMNEIQ